MAEKTIEQNALREAEETELRLRRERADLPAKISEASRRALNLRGQGFREGAPELEEALREVRELVDRERTLPAKILDAVAKRCELEAQALREQEKTLLVEYEGLQTEAQKARRALQKARHKVGEATALAEGNAMRRARLGEAAMALEHVVRRAREAEGEEKKLRVLEEARIGGMLMPFEAHSSS